MSKQIKKVLIATGGSGGHIIPGLAIADKLSKDDVNVEFIGSAGGFSRLIEEKGYKFHNLKAFKYNDQGLLGKAKAIFFVYLGMLSLIFKFKKLEPDFVLGMGSYASVAAIAAAKLSGIGTGIHEQNVKPGRTNKLLFRFADRIFLSFEETKQYLSDRVNAKNHVIVAGCPVKDEILSNIKTKRSTDKKFRILVLGGSQGSRILSDVIPQAIITLPEEIKKNIIVTQQTRPEDLQRVKEVYAQYDIQADVASYYDNVAELTRQANLLIARSGAGTVCETAVLGRVAIYVPLLLADGHQMENARVVTDKNASFILETVRFTPANLSYEILRLIENPDIIKDMEKNASKAIPNSATAALTISNDILNK